MNKQLLYTTLRTYMFYSLLVLMIAAPICYYAIATLYTKEADDTLLLHKREFLYYDAPKLQQTSIPLWNAFNRNRKLDSTKHTPKEILFFSHYLDTLDEEIEPYREINLPVIIQGKAYTYSDKINLVEKEDLQKSIVGLFICIITVLLIGFIIITHILTKRLWQPFYQILQQIEQFEINQQSPPIFKKSKVQEFDRLQSSIKQLIQKNTQIYKNQQEFIENAAHELQTPLAIFKAQIDSFIQNTEITTSQAVILAQLHQQVNRLERLNKNLLLLSKMDNQVYHHKQPYSITSAIQKNLAFFTEQAAAKNILITTLLNTQIQLHTNVALADILLNNLFLNAIKHNIPGGTITINTHHKQICFSNTGSPIALSNSHLFQRFSKLNPSTDGSGLGLAIIKKIADLNDWQITYDYKEGQHIFSLQF